MKNGHRRSGATIRFNDCVKTFSLRFPAAAASSLDGNAIPFNRKISDTAKASTVISGRSGPPLSPKAGFRPAAAMAATTPITKKLALKKTCRWLAISERKNVPLELSSSASVTVVRARVGRGRLVRRAAQSVRILGIKAFGDEYILGILGTCV